MSVSPLSFKQVHSPPRSTDSPFIPLHCLYFTSYIFLPLIFHIRKKKSLFYAQPFLILVKHWTPGWVKSQLSYKHSLYVTDRSRILNWLTEYFNYDCFQPSCAVTQYEPARKEEKKSSQYKPWSAAATQLSSSTPASVYKQSHSCCHWYCTCKREQVDPPVSSAALEISDPLIWEEFVTPTNHSTCVQF